MIDALTAPGIGLFLLEIVVKGTLILALAFLLASVLRRGSAAVRHGVWSLAFIGLLILPLCIAFLPSWRVAVPFLHPAEPAPVLSADPPAPVDAAAPAYVVSNGKADVDLIAPPSQEAAVIAPAPVAAGRAFPWGRALLYVWVAGALALLVRLGLTLAKLSMVRRRATPVEDEEWSDLANVLGEVLEIGRPVRLLQHPEVAVPMTYGVRQPVVLLPAKAEAWPEEQKHVTLMHELLHVKRLDYLTHVVALVARAFHWYNPLAWYASKRLLVERERACDDGVLSMGVASTSYADHLVGMARQLLTGREASAGALAMARHTELRSRVLAILDPRQRRYGLTRLRAAGMMGCAMAFILPLAAMHPATDDGAQPRSNPVSYNVMAPDPVAEVDQEHRTESGRSAWVVGQSEGEREKGREGERGKDASVGDHPDPLADAAIDLAGQVIRHAAGALKAMPQSEPALNLTGEVLAHIDEAITSGAFAIADGELADTSDIETQKKALFALSQLPPEQAIPLLTEIAKTNRNPEIRAEAVFWLGQAGGAQAADALENFARSDASVEVQKKALFALSQLPPEAGTPRLTNLAKSHPDPEMRADAVFWIGQQGGSAAAEVLEAFARNDASLEVQKKALFALSQIPNEEGVPRLINLAKTHPNAEMREQAIFWLGQSGDPRAADVLLDIVNGR